MAVIYYKSFYKKISMQTKQFFFFFFFKQRDFFL